MEGVTGIADDMIIAGKDEMEHNRNFLAFMEKCMENNLTLNSEKIQFKQSQVSFYGHIWSEHGISPDPKRIQALQLPIIAVNLITVHILMSAHPQDTFSRKLDQLRKSTAQDNQLTRLSCYINTGFPCEKKNLPTDLQEFWNYRDTLSIKNGLLTCGSRIISST